MYQAIKSGVFSSKFLFPNTMYEISAGADCIRLQPYGGARQFNYLRWARPDTGIPTIPIPHAVMRRTGLHNKVFALQIGDTFYLVHPSFRGDPFDVKFSELPAFPRAKKATSVFLKEADGFDLSAAVRPDTGKRGVRLFVRIPKDFQALLKTKQNCVQISIHEQYGRKWLEMRPAVKGSILCNEDRLPANAFVPSLSGVSVTVPVKRNCIFLQDLAFSGWDCSDLRMWYSNVRKAVIIESAPELCAICGAPIRSIAPEHHTAMVCEDCESELGPGNAIDVIVSAKKAIKTVEEIV